tara:strand:+ start:293 stop:1219 length:927 start_codon:yes stop_codon:yes gene_type:complete
MKILVVKPSSLGDVIHSLRVMNVAKNYNERISIDWVIKREIAGILDATGIVEHSFYFDRGQGLLSYVKLILEIRKKKYDFCMDMQGLLRSGIITALSKSRFKIGRKDGREFSTLFYEKVKEGFIKKPNHAIEKLLPFLNRIGINNFPQDLPLSFPHSTLGESVKIELNRFRKYIVLFPESRRKEKEWPYFEKLALKLKQFPHFGIVIAGTRKNGQFPETVDLRGRLSVNELPQLIKKSALIISNDSAPLHIASSLQVPSISLFGPTDSRNYGPYPPGKNQSVVFNGKNEQIGSIELHPVMDSIKTVII